MIDCKHDVYDQLLSHALPHANSSSSKYLNGTNKHQVMRDVTDAIFMAPDQAPVEDIMTVYRDALLSSRIKHKACIHPHDCNERGCILLNYRNVYLCTDTGNIHYCTPSACEFMISSKSGLPCCSLTGVEFQNQYDHQRLKAIDKKGSSDFGDFVGTGPVILTSSISTNAGAGQSRKRIRSMLSSTSESNPIVKTGAATKRKRKRVQSQELPIIKTMINALLIKMPLLEEYKSKLIEWCHHTWVNLVLPSKMFAEHSGAYTLPYHVCVIVYRCQRGISIVPSNRHMIVPCIIQDPKAWPNTRQLADIKMSHSHFVAKIFTRTGHLLIECVSEARVCITEHESKAQRYLNKWYPHLRVCIESEMTYSDPVFKDTLVIKDTLSNLHMEQIKDRLSKLDTTKYSVVHLICNLPFADTSFTLRLFSCA